MGALLKSIILIVSFCASFLFVAPVVWAEDLGGFEFTSFESKITLHQDATFDVVETIKGNFFEERHGIFRNLPYRYTRSDGSLFKAPLKVVGVKLNQQPTPYDVYSQGAFKVIKIGDPDQTIIGPFVYEIEYQVMRSILFHESTDELYWNVTGDQWGVPLENVRAQVIFPALGSINVLASCFTGTLGSVTQDCLVEQIGGIVEFKADDFLTISLELPKGIIQEPSLWQKRVWWLQEHWDYFLYLIPILVFLLMFRQWYKHGRDHKGRGTIIAEYEPPKGLRPTEMGTLVDAKLHPNDFSAAIIDLAVRGYLKIIETEKKGWLTTNQEYSFEKLKEPDDLKEFEQKVFKAIFGDHDKVEFNDRKVELAKARDKVASLMYRDMAAKGYYVDDPQKVQKIYAVIGILIMGLAFIFVPAVLGTSDRVINAILPTGLSGLLVLIFAKWMPKKTKQGTLAYEHALGFKEFLSTAERYRLEWQEKEHIFEEYLPYAMVFGVADKWAKALSELVKEPPKWYQGDFSTFNAASLASSVGSFASAASSVSVPSSSGGGSYSGGGGFSGGGFGGGGGGSW
ncbi:DUF2207 domain-containing protein [Patescibacteria group bacterium]